MKRLKDFSIFLLLIIMLIAISSTAVSRPFGGNEDAFLPEQGSYFNYHLMYERILPSGDFLGIKGNAEIVYLNKLNSSHINVKLEAIVDLSWIQGKQDLNFSQDIISRSITIDEYQGEIIKGVLYYFGNEAQFFNPIHISPELISNKAEVNIWSYSAINYNSRTITWNYKQLQVSDYFFSDSEYSYLGVNASFHLSTGILMIARCYFLEYTSLGLIQHILYVNLINTNIPMGGKVNLTPTFLFLGFTTIITILPAFFLVSRFLKKPKLLMEGGS